MQKIPVRGALSDVEKAPLMKTNKSCRSDTLLLSI